MSQSKIFSERIKTLQKALRAEKKELFFIKNSVDLYYLTGIHMSLGHLYVGQTKARLFVDGRYFESVQKTSPVPVASLTSENQVDFLKGGKRVGFDSGTLTFQETTDLRGLCRKAKVKTFADPHLLMKLRLIKDDGEIRLMKKSAEFAYKAYEWARRRLKTGMTELDLATDLKIYCLKNGAEGMSFEPIVAFGKNTALPHHHPGKNKLKVNDVVLFDLGVVLGGYCSDMTRVCFVGKPDPKISHLFEINKAAQRMALAKCRPGVRLKELDQAARRVMRSADLEEYFIHGLGHGIGLEVHEYPRINSTGPDRNLTLEAGMAITIEPGLYLPGKGGVRYEDTIVITPKGYTNLYPEDR